MGEVFKLSKLTEGYTENGQKLKHDPFAEMKSYDLAIVTSRVPAPPLKRTLTPMARNGNVRV